MKKRKLSSGSKKAICCILTASMMVASLTACGKTDTKDSNTLFGKITSIEGSTITLALMNEMNAPDGDIPQKPGGEGNAPNGEKPPEAPPDTSNGQAPQMPSGALDGEAPQISSDLQDNQPPDMQNTLTGEEKVITVTDSTTYTINGETGALSDLSVGNIISVSLKDDTAESITIQMGGPGKMDEINKTDNGETL